MRFDFSIVTGKTVSEILSSRYQECVDAVREAYLLHEAGQTVNPDSYFFRLPDQPGCRIIALPAYLGGKDRVSGIKWISSYPQNVEKGFPRASAVLVLNSYETGYPFACLESSIISAARTTASAALAAEQLSRTGKRVKRLGFVGTGLISRYMYRFLMGLGWEVEEVALHDLRPADAERFAAQVLEPRHAQARHCQSADELLRTSDLVVLATTAATPYLHDPAVLAHSPLVLNISLRDLAPALLLASENVVDDVDHVMKANSSPHLTEQQVGSRDFVRGTLAQVIEGKVKVDRTRPVIFSPFGMGILDLAVGKWIYDEAGRRDALIRIPDFFHDLSR